MEEGELKELDYWKNMYGKPNVFGTGETKLALMAMDYFLREDIETIMELGCGQGRDSMFFAGNGFSVTATDFSNEAIEFVKNEALGKHPNLKTHLHDIRDEWFFNEIYDSVYSNLALQFFKQTELEQIFKNIHKNLKSRGLFIFSTKKPGDKYHNTGKKINEHAFMTKGITRYFFDKNIIINTLEEHFSIEKFGEENHVNLDKTISAWWYFIARKK